ncbi:MAG: hypothetical protein AB7G17_10000 [Phycisphaerales bacterium]
MFRAFRAVVPAMIGVWLGGASSASLVVFSNAGGEFAWSGSQAIPFDPFFIRGQGLDVTLPPSQSGGATSLSTLYVWGNPVTSTELVATTFEREGANVRVAQGSTVNVMAGGGQADFTLARVFDVGESVGASETWVSSTTAGFYSFTTGDVPLLGTSAYVGVELSIAGLTHYGWIHLLWDPTVISGRSQYRATTWAYETDAGMPARVIPAPGAAGLLACSCIMALRQRRR